MDIVNEQAAKADALTGELVAVLNKSSGDHIVIMAAAGGMLAGIALAADDPVPALAAMTKVAVNIIARHTLETQH